MLLYGALPEGDPNRTMVAMRAGGGGSLIEVRFRMHSADEARAEPRVPGGAPFMSVEARLSTVRLVYMQRFLNEFTEYLAGEIS